MAYGKRGRKSKKVGRRGGSVNRGRTKTLRVKGGSPGRKFQGGGKF